MIKLNKTYLGVITGLIMPFIVLVIIFTASGNGANLFGLPFNKETLKLLSPFIRLSLIVNLLFFIPYGKGERTRFLRGLLVSTFVYGIIVVIIHFL